MRIPERLSDLGVLPPCNGSVENFLQLYQPDGRTSPWKKFAEQHLSKRSKSAETLLPSTPDLKPLELLSLSSSFNSRAWRLSVDDSQAHKTALSKAKHTIQEEQAQEEAQENEPQRISPSIQARDILSSPSGTCHSMETIHRTVSEAVPETENNISSLGSSAGRLASINIPPYKLPDSESASVHLHNMRISQHLRSESTLSGISHATSGVSGAQLQPQDHLARGSFTNASGLGVPPLHTQHSDRTVRVRPRRTSSSGFASERVPEGWGNVVSAAPSSIYVGSEKAYEPSSVYSTRQNSLVSTQAASRLNIAAIPSTPGNNGHMRKSGYEVLKLDDVGFLKMANPADGIEKGKETEDTTIPGAFPQDNSMSELGRVDTSLTFRTAIEPAGTSRTANDRTDEATDKQPAHEISDPTEEMTDSAEDRPLRLNQHDPEQTDSSLDITPVTAAESPIPSEETPRAQIATPAPSKHPVSAKDKKKAPSIKTPSKRFSTFSFLRSKTYANLRRASLNPTIHARKASKSEEHLPLEENIVSTEARGMNNNTDGPSDPHLPGDSHSHDHSNNFSHGRGHDHSGVVKNSVASDAIEDHRPGRLSRSWLIGDGRDTSGRMLGQSAVWENALQKHREEKSALFLPPEKGGKAEARGLFRERSGSGSALSTTSKQGDRKGKGPAIGVDFTFGERSPGILRSQTVLLDPLEQEFGEELARHRDKSAMLGDELRQDRMSSQLTPSLRPSPGVSLHRQPSLVSIDQDLHIDSWGDTTLAEFDLGDLGTWNRYPSHTREQRTGPAGEADNVRARDFAYEVIRPSTIEAEESTEEEENSGGAIKRLTTLRPKKKSKTRSGMSKSKSMTFSRNFSFLKHYIGLFRSQSEEFRKHGHGHRSSIAESGTLEHPELEILPSVFSPVNFDMADASRYQTDGVNSQERFLSQGKSAEATDAHSKAKVKDSEQRCTVPQIAPPNRRREGKVATSDGSWAANALLWTQEFGNKPDPGNRRLLKRTDSSDRSWAANALLWTRELGSESDHGNQRFIRQADSSAESWDNAHTRPRYDSSSQEFQEFFEDLRQKIVFSPMSLERQGEEPADSLAEGTTIAVPEKAADKTLEQVSEKLLQTPQERNSERILTVKRPCRKHHSSSDEWRSDARLFSQIYEPCVQALDFSSLEDTNACEAIQTSTAQTHKRSASESSAFHLPSTRHLDSVLAQAAGNAERAKLRSVLGSHSSSAVKRRNGIVRNDSSLSIGDMGSSAMEFMRLLHDLGEGDRDELEKFAEA